MGIKYFGDTFGANSQAVPTNERLVARYVHKANSVLNIASLDIATGIFTTSNPIVGTYSAGSQIQMVLNYTNAIPPKLFAEWNGINEYGLEYIDSTHFYVVNRSSANARITSYAANTVDLSQIVFEYNASNNGGNPPQVSIDLSGVSLGNYIRTVWAGVRSRPGYTRLDLNGTYGPSNATVSNLGFSMLDGRHFMVGYAEVILHYQPESGLLIRMEGRNANRQWSGGTSWAYAAGAGSARELDFYPNLKIKTADFYNYQGNGSVIEIYTTA